MSQSVDRRWNDGVNGKTNPSRNEEEDKDTCYEIPSEELKEILDSFRLFDREDEGFIDARKLFGGMRALGYNPTEAEVLDLISSVDTEGRSEISVDEFLSMLSSRIRKNPTDEELADVFRVFDVDADGKITTTDMEKLFLRTGRKNISSDEIQRMISDAGLRNRDSITREDFIGVYRGTP